MGTNEVLLFLLSAGQCIEGEVTGLNHFWELESQETADYMYS